MERESWWENGWIRHGHCGGINGIDLRLAQIIIFYHVCFIHFRPDSELRKL